MRSDWGHKEEVSELRTVSSGTQNNHEPNWKLPSVAGLIKQHSLRLWDPSNWNTENELESWPWSREMKAGGQSREGLKRYEIRVWLRGWNESLERKLCLWSVCTAAYGAGGPRLGREAQKAYFQV